MHFPKPKPAIVAPILGALVVFAAVSAGWPQQREPRQDQQAAPAPMWPGMMRGPMMGAMPMGDMNMNQMGDMNQMMQACVQMMNQMMSGETTAPPAQPGQGGR